MIVTVVDAVVAADREAELRWRIQTTWRDREAVLALQARGEPPAATRLLKSVEATHTHEVFTVEEGSQP